MNQLQQTKNIAYTDRGLIIPDSISDLELKKEIKSIFAAKESLPFAVGDLLCFLAKRSQAALELKGQRLPYNKEHLGIYKSLLDADKSNKSYLICCKKVCSIFPTDKRTFPVPFYTYKEAVGLAKEAGAATELLKEATANDWSYRELRKAFRTRQAAQGGQVNANRSNPIAEIAKLANDLSRRLKGTFSPDERGFILKELIPVIKWVEEGTKQ